MSKLKSVLAVIGLIFLLIWWKANSPETWTTFWNTVLGAF